MIGIAVTSVAANSHSGLPLSLRDLAGIVCISFQTFSLIEETFLHVTGSYGEIL